VRQAETDRNDRPGTSTAEKDRLKELERENRELQRANENKHRERFGVEPICKALQFPSSTYYAALERRRNPSVRECRDRELLDHIYRVHAGNHGVYGARKIWLQLKREGVHEPRCRIERLMRAAGLHGAARGGTKPRSARPGPETVRTPDLVDRAFTADAPTGCG